MPKINVKKLHIHKLKTDTDSANPTYDTAEFLSESIQITVTPKISEGELYADGVMTDSDSSVTSFDIALDIRDLPPSKRAKINNLETDEHGMVVDIANADPVYFGVTFEAERSDGTTEYRALYKVRFTPAGDEYATKTQNIDYQTAKINGKSMAIKKLTPKGKTQFGASIVGTEDNKTITGNWHKAMQFIGG